MGHHIRHSKAQGSLQSVLHNKEGFYGFSDTRRQGAGVAVY
jgi:gamma-glutamyltranspeptidase